MIGTLGEKVFRRRRDGQARAFRKGDRLIRRLNQMCIRDSSQKAAEERVDQKAELAKRFKEARSMLDEIDAPAGATPSGEKAASPEGV